MAFEFDASTATPDGFDPSTATPDKPAGAIRKLADLGLSAAKGVIAVPEAAVGLANLATQGRAGKAVESAGIRFKDAKDVLTGFQSDDLKSKQQEFQSADGILAKTGVALSNPSLIANTVAESVPLMGAGALPARAVMAAAPRLGAVGAGAIGEGVAGAGSAGEQIRQETTDGLLTGKQAALGAATGVATGVFGAVGGKLANRLGIGDVDTMLAKGSLGVAQSAKPTGLVGRVAGGAFSEGVLEELPQSVSEQALQNVALDKPITQGLEDAAVMGTLAGGVMGAGAGAATRQPSIPTTDPIAEPEAPAAPTRSQAMGINPAAGPISAAAAMAVDSGAHDLEIAKQTMQAAQEAEPEKASPSEAAPVADVGNPIPANVNPETGEIISAFDQREASKPEPVGALLPGVDGQPANFTNIIQAKRAAKEAGDGWTIFKRGTRDFAVYLPEISDVGTDAVQPLPSADSGAGRADGVPSVVSGDPDGLERAAEPSGPAADSVVQPSELPGGSDAAPLNKQAPGALLPKFNPQPTTLGKPGASAVAGPGFTAANTIKPVFQPQEKASEPQADQAIQSSPQPEETPPVQPAIAQPASGGAVQPQVEAAEPSASTLVAPGLARMQAAKAKKVKVVAQPPVAEPVKKTQYSGNSHFASGRADQAAGKPRELPSYFTGKSINSRAWLAGWDAVNAEVPAANSAPDSKESWQMTRDEYAGQQPPAYRVQVGNSHKRDVARSVADGKNVPSKVLADYPELSKSTPLTRSEDLAETLRGDIEKSNPKDLGRAYKTEADRVRNSAENMADTHDVARAYRGAADILDGLAEQESEKAQATEQARGQKDIEDAAPAAESEKIDDVGEKIGGARKDTAVSTGAKRKTVAEDDERPTWAKRFQIAQVAGGFDMAVNGRDITGKWTISDLRNKDRFDQPKRTGEYFNSKEEAEAALPLLAVAQKHRVSSTGQKNAEGGHTYEIWRDVNDRKRVKVVNQEFNSREEAMKYMAVHAAEILETNTTFGEADLPKPENTGRVGVERRTGDVKGEDFRDAFGFRGVEFGLWNNQEERQEVMNAAYDGLLDLAEVLKVPPKAIGLNGDLALAFGARGKGLSGARAHYETDRVVMNLTKMNGAGALAHEWFHALDHYLARQDGKTTAEWKVNKDGTRSLDVRGGEADMASSGFLRNNSGVREELRTSYTSLVQSLFTKAEQYVEDTARADKFVAVARGELQKDLNELRQDLSEQKDVRYYKRNNKPASAEQLAEFDAMAAELVEGRGLSTEWKSVPAKTKYGIQTRHTNETLEKLNELYKTVRGRSGFNTEKRGVLDGLTGYMRRYDQRLQMLREATALTEKTKRVPTSFAMDAKSLDQGRGGDYWTTPHEMVARAFQGYVEDAIASKEGRSPFLNYAPENAGILTPWGAKRPYPSGEERKAMNAEFEKFVDVVQTKETEQGVALFNTPDSDYTIPDGSNPDQSTAATPDQIAVLAREVGAGVGIAEPYIGRPINSYLLDGRVLQRLAGAFGTKIAGFATNPVLNAIQRGRVPKFNGVYLNSTIYIREGTDRPNLAVLGHEFGHYLRDKRPDLYDKLVQTIRPFVKEDAYPAFKNTPVALNSRKTGAAIREEFIGEVLSDGFMDKNFWKAVGDKNPSLLGQLVDALSNLIDTIKAKVGYTPKTQKYLSDYGAVMKIAGEVAAEMGVKPMFSRQPFYSALANQSTAKALNATLVNYGLGQDWSSAYEAVKLPDALSGVREAIQTAFGRDVRPVAPTAAKFNIFNGVYIPSQPNAVYVNVASDVGFVNIAGHELWHVIKRQRPDLVKWYQTQSRQFYKDLPAYQTRLNALLQPGEKPYNLAKAEEELEADFLGDSLTDPEFLQQLADASPSKFKELLNRVKMWLGSVLSKLKGLGSTKEVSDVKALQVYLKDVLVAFAEGKNIPTAPDSGGAQTDTPAFRKWFGDSVVTEDGKAGGKPLVVYHGTDADFSTYGANGGMYTLADGTKKGTFYFTSSTKLASDYATEFTSAGRKIADIPDSSSNVQPVFLSLKNPLVVEADGRHYSKVNADAIGNALDNGNDGVIVKNVIDSPDGGSKGNPTDVYIAFRQNQIKSAIGNNGDFDSDNPDIRFSRSISDTLNTAANSVKDVKLPAGYLVGDLINAAPGKLNWWHKTIGTQYNLAQRSAPFKRVFDSVQNFIGDVSFYATEAADLAPNILPKLETWKDITKAPLSAQDTKAISAPIFEGTLTWARDESGKPIKMAELEAQAAKMTVEQKAQRLMRNQHITAQILKMWQGLPIEQFESIINGKYEREMLKAGVVWTPAELKAMFGLTDKQVSLYQEFRTATDKSLTNLAVSDMLRFGGDDVAAVRDKAMVAPTADKAAGILAEHLREMAELIPERNDVLLDTADRMIEKGDRATDLMARGYAPLSRFGQYTLDVVHDGERIYFGMFENKVDAARMARDMEKQFPGAQITRGTVSEQAYKMFAGVSPETLELFGNMLGLEASGDAASAQAFQTYLKLAKSNRSSMKRLIERKGIAGFNEDSGRVLAGFVYSNARQTASNLHIGEMTQAAADNQAFGRNGELQDAAVKLVDYIKNPQEEAQAVRGLLFAQYIGGSVASAMVNLTQPLTMTFPWLSQYGGVTKAAKQMAAATKDALKKRTGDKDLDAALRRAEEDGTVSPQEVHQLMAQSMGKGGLRSGDGTKAGDAMALAQNSLSRVSLAWGKLFSVAEQFNRRSTFIAAYRTAVAEGMADPDAFARKAIAETQGIYNKGNKPAWARGAIGGTLFTFKQFSISYMEMLSRMAKNGPEGKKAALLALAVLFLMSGAGGAPGADDLDDIISGALQALGYNFDSKVKRREFFASVVGEGGALFLERGLSGLPGAPIDVSGRMGMGNLIPGTGLFTKKTDHTRDVAEIAGPAGDLFKRAFTAAGQLVQGEAVSAVTTISPTAIQNLTKAYDMANMGMYRDQSGKKVIDTDASDAVAKAIGFQPNDVKKVQDASREVQRMIGLNKMRETEIADKWAKGLFEKDPSKVQEARDELAQWNADNAESPIRISFGQVIKRLKAMNQTKEERLIKTAPKEIRNTVRQELMAAR